MALSDHYASPTTAVFPDPLAFECCNNLTQVEPSPRSLLQLNPSGHETPNVLLKLEEDDYILGMPRLIFVMLAGVVGVALVALGGWCFSCRQRTRDARREYLFTQIPSDDKRPLCEEAAYDVVRKPYYDEDELPPTETDSEEDIVLLRSENNWKNGE